MKAETFIDAMSAIDDRYLKLDNQPNRVSKPSIVRRITAIAAAAALILLPLPVSTAFGSDSAYNILYHIAPGVAQTFKPVQRSCTDQGIEMTVISADISGSEASVYLAMHDTTGTCPEGEWDLYDSYNINVWRDMTGHCSFSEYDADTSTAYFVVHLETMDGSDMPEGKVTFSVRELLLGKMKTEGYLDDVEMNNIPFEPETIRKTDIDGKYFYREEKNPEDYRFLPLSEVPVSEPAKDASIMNIGYIDGALHILSRYNNVSETDSHGFISLLDKNEANNFEEKEFGFTYHNADHSASYVEQIIPVAYDELGDYRLYGEFYTNQKHISGDWEVTFRLE